MGEREKERETNKNTNAFFFSIQGLKMELWGLVRIQGESQVISFTRAQILGGAGGSEGLTPASPSLLPRELFHRTKPTSRLDSSKRYLQVGLETWRPHRRPLKTGRGFILLLEVN